MVLEPRCTVSTTRSPGAWVTIRVERSLLVSTVWPSTAVMTSPSLSPALAAGLPLTMPL